MLKLAKVFLYFVVLIKPKAILNVTFLKKKPITVELKLSKQNNTVVKYILITRLRRFIQNK